MAIETISLRRVSREDLADVEAIFDDLRGYSLRVDGRSSRPGAALAFVTALPPGLSPDRKHCFIATRQDRPFGLLDVIQDHPVRGTAFIGLLAVREALQGAGLGAVLFSTAERFIRDDLDARVVRLAVVEANPVIGFWQQLGFRPTGEIKPYEGLAIASRSILMEKTLQPAAA